MPRVTYWSIRVHPRTGRPVPRVTYWSIRVHPRTGRPVRRVTYWSIRVHPRTGRPVPRVTYWSIRVRRGWRAWCGRRLASVCLTPYPTSTAVRPVDVVPPMSPSSTSGGASADEAAVSGGGSGRRRRGGGSGRRRRGGGSGRRRTGIRRAADAVVDGDDRGADLDGVALGGVQGGHRAGEGHRQLDDGLCRLDLDDDVVDLDGVTDGDVPGDQLCLGEALARVRKLELTKGHVRERLSVREGAVDDVSTRSRSGRNSSSSRLGGYGTS